jgi:histone H3/H4
MLSLSQGEILRLARAAGISRLGADMYPVIQNQVVHLIQRHCLRLVPYIQSKKRKTVEKEMVEQVFTVPAWSKEALLLRTARVERMLRSALPDDFRISPEGMLMFQAVLEHSVLEWLTHVTEDQKRRQHKTLNAVDVLSSPSIPSSPAQPVKLDEEPELKEASSKSDHAVLSFDGRLKDKWGIQDRKLRKVLDVLIQHVVRHVARGIQTCSEDKGHSTIRKEEVRECGKSVIPASFMLVDPPAHVHIGKHTMKRALSQNGRRISVGAETELAVLIHRIVDTILGLMTDKTYAGFLAMVERYTPVQTLMEMADLQVQVLAKTG